MTTEVHVPAGRVLTIANRPGNEFFVVLRGTATVWREDIQLDVVGPGSFFGELALLNHCGRTASVIANTDMALLVLTCREFRSRQFLVPAVIANMLVVMSERLCRADERWMESTSTSTSTSTSDAHAGLNPR